MKTPAPRPKARKGTRGRKNEIGRYYHHGAPDVEERAIERTVRQAAKKAIRRDPENAR